MPLTLIQPPSDDVITLEEAKAHLRVDHSDDDELIERLIKGTVNLLDPAGGGWLGRALRPQVWRLSGDGFPTGYAGSGYGRNFRRYDEIELPYPPLIAVDSFVYDDANGVEQELIEGTHFRVIPSGPKNKARVLPIYNGAWPSSVRGDVESVRIEFSAGYPVASGDDPESLPEPIRVWLLMKLGTLYEHRDEMSAPQSAALPPWIENQIETFRIHS